MLNENIANVKLFIQSLSNSITNYSTSLTPLQNKSLSDLLTSLETSSDSSTNSSIKDQLTILNNYAYVLISTLFAYLKLIGVETDNHPIMKELSRIKESMKRLKNIDLDESQQIKLEQEKQKQEEEKKKNYLNKVIGVKSNGLGNATGPAISKKNFTGVHTKFDDELIENLPDLSSESDAKGGISRQDKKNKSKKTKLKSKSTSSSSSSSKVTKPKKNTKKLK